ncbi:MAG: GNAT family N-acetyltransferase [Chthoniobacteraceae bacterium]
MTTTFVDPLSEPRWDEWIQAHPEATPFHSTGWAKVLSATYGHRPFYMRIVSEGRTTALVPLMEVRSWLTGTRGVGLPFTDYCAPLVFERLAAPLIFDALTALARDRKWRYLEVRGPLSPNDGATPSVEFLGHTVSLAGGEEKLLAGCSSPVRRAIRKAEKSGVSVGVSQSGEALAEFCRLHARTRRRHGVPPQPAAFFRNIHREMIEPGAGFTVVARREGHPVAGAVFLRFGEKAVYKFGASIDEGQEIRANNLVMWEGIRFLAAQGCDSLDFGRTSVTNEGLRHFKLGWGTREQRLCYYKFDPEAKRWMTARDNASGLHNVLFRSLPLFANRLAGTILYPHLD